ncbi:hypothetical protein FV139_04515 [Parahaliea maris]|uniref:Uncharacterized protein n=1 Tax=Parahaliea maris TaxID=2716870 RepID=A0A5C9AAX8_9GAMM|nr:hypothetical protein FV139_04515 [Parahaliea maris]
MRDYPVEQILRGARHAIEHSEYLPTLNRMHECCQAGLAEFGLPSTRDAYREACNAPSPKAAQRWSHPAVYLAGRDSEWFFLANNTEQKALPVFERHYREYCARVMRGEQLTIPPEQALEHHEAAPLPVEEQLAQLKKLREETGI